MSLNLVNVVARIFLYSFESCFLRLLRFSSIAVGVTARNKMAHGFSAFEYVQNVCNVLSQIGPPSSIKLRKNIAKTRCAF